MRFAAIGFEFAWPMIAGAILGHYLDLYFHTDPWLTLVMFLLGVFAGFWRLIQELALVSARESRVLIVACRRLMLLSRLESSQISRGHSRCAGILKSFSISSLPSLTKRFAPRRLQFVRKISGFNKPSKANEAPFMTAIDEIAGASARFLRSLETNAPSRNREEEAAKAKARAAERFGA